MARPYLARAQAQRVHVHHRIGCSDLLLGHLSNIETRSDLSLLFVSEPNKDVRMLTRLKFYRFVEGRQQRCAAPIVHDSIAFEHTIEVRAYDDDPVGAVR